MPWPFARSFNSPDPSTLAVSLAVPRERLRLVLPRTRLPCARKHTERWSGDISAPDGRDRGHSETRRTPLGAVGRERRALHDDALYALARRRARPRVRRLRVAVALVGQRDRELLGLDLGFLRGRGLRALLRGPPRPRDAGRGLVSRRPPELSAAHLPQSTRRRRRRPPRLGAPGPRRAHLGRAPGPGRPRRRGPPRAGR